MIFTHSNLIRVPLKGSEKSNDRSTGDAKADAHQHCDKDVIFFFNPIITKTPASNAWSMTSIIPLKFRSYQVSHLSINLLTGLPT